MKKIIGLILFMGGAVLTPGALRAQNYYAVNTSNANKLESKITNSDTRKKDNLEAVKQVSKHLQENVKVDQSILQYLQNVVLVVAVDVNSEGLISGSHIEKGTGTILDKQVLETMESLERVQPIVINGKERARTIQIPVVFK